MMSVILYYTIGITYTADYEMYEYYFDQDSEKMDAAFIYLTGLFKEYKLSFHDLYIFHIVTSLLAYSYFISRFTKNVFYVLVIFLVLYYVPYVNQIRYYLGFPMFLLSIYFLLIRKKYLPFILFALLAFFCHSAIVILYTFIPCFYFLSTKKYLKTMVTSSLVGFVLMFVLFKMGLTETLEHFGAYFDKSSTSSTLGGIFNALPYFVYIIYILKINKEYTQRTENYEDDIIYTFLSKLTFFTIIFIPASLFIQILGHRYVFPFIIVWVIFFLYTIRTLPIKRKTFKMLEFLCIHILAFLIFYILPKYLFKESFYEVEFLKIIKYIKHT